MRLHHRVDGPEDAPVLVFSNSIGTTLELWEPQVPALSGRVPVRAPFAGEVLERSLGLGALVQPGDKALLMADTSRVWVQADLYEREVAGFLEAQRANLARALAGERVGTVITT